MKKTLWIVMACMVPLCAGAMFAQRQPFEALPLKPGTAYAEPADPAASEENLLLVNASHPLPEDYAPAELVNLYAQKKRSFQLASSDISVDKQVFEAMNRMFRHAKDDGVDGFIITSGYRSRAKQRQVYDESAEGFAALPGQSEHESGLAFDVTAYSGGDFGTTEQFAWLKDNCWDFGFILRYPEGKTNITNTGYEPWHYRYVGAADALAMRDSGQTLEEYLGEA